MAYELLEIQIWSKGGREGPQRARDMDRKVPEACLLRFHVELVSPIGIALGCIMEKGINSRLKPGVREREGQEET